MIAWCNSNAQLITGFAEEMSTGRATGLGEEAIRHRKSWMRGVCKGERKKPDADAEAEVKTYFMNSTLIFVHKWKIFPPSDIH